ncbi:MAG: response regulator [Elusimicrobiota bacterium]
MTANQELPRANVSTRVLVIDDEPGIRDMLSYSLRRFGCVVSAAANGEQGVAAARAADFDVVICDVMMPGMDGFAVLEILKREQPLVEVIMVTGYPTPETSSRSAELGAFGNLDKPYELGAMRAMIDAAAARKRERSCEKGPVAR